MVKVDSYIKYFTKKQMENTNGSKLARRIVRRRLRDEQHESNRGGPSTYAGIPSRKERRALARKNRVPFEPLS